VKHSIFRAEVGNKLAEETAGSKRAQCKVEKGEWKTENGKWRMENGEWKMENGKWRMENGKWKTEVEGIPSLLTTDH
jgi:hypothetical protein